jgi:hypothetical protein
MQNQHTTSAIETTKVSPKQVWSIPAVQDFNPDLIQQQEEEILQLLSDESAFKLLSGSLNG